MVERNNGDMEIEGGINRGRKGWTEMSGEIDRERERGRHRKREREEEMEKWKETR